MQLSIERKKILPVLTNMVKIAAGKPIMPITSHVYVEAVASDFKMVATDLEVQLSVHLKQAVDEPGNCAVPARKLYDICRALPEDAVLKLKRESEKLLIKAGKSRFTLQILPAEEFPYLHIKTDAHTIRVKAESFLDALDFASVAMANNDARTYLNGILMEMDALEMRLVATDGHRLSKISLPYTNDGSVDAYQAILPRKAVMELLQIMPGAKEGGNLKLYLSDTSFVLENGSQQFASKLIDARFPDYRRVIPSGQPESRVTMDRATLKSALLQSCVLISDKNPTTTIQVEPDLMKLYGRNDNHEEGETEMEVEYHGDPMRLSFNSLYLSQMVGMQRTETLNMDVYNTGANIFTADGVENAIHLIMPIRE